MGQASLPGSVCSPALLRIELHLQIHALPDVAIVGLANGLSGVYIHDRQRDLSVQPGDLLQGWSCWSQGWAPPRSRCTPGRLRSQSRPCTQATFDAYLQSLHRFGRSVQLRVPVPSNKALRTIQENARSYADGLQQRIIFYGIYLAAAGERRPPAVRLKPASVKDGRDRLFARIYKGRVVLEGMARSIESSIRHLIQPDLGLN